jgi:hypothetical protein
MVWIQVFIFIDLPWNRASMIELDRLATRIQELELEQRSLARQVRIWHRIAMGVGSLGVLAILGGAAALQTVKSIEAQEFVLRDGDGHARAALAMRPDQTPGLGFFDPQGKIRLSLETAPDGSPRVHLFQTSGQLRAAFALRPDGTPGVGLFDELGVPRISMDLCPDNAAGFNIYDPNGTLRAAVALRPDGTPGVGLFDGEGRLIQSMDMAADPLPPANPQPKPLID